MAVEMHDVIRLASLLGEPQRFIELLVSRRPENVELEDFAVRVAQTFHDPTGDGTEGNILLRTGPADRQQDSDLAVNPRRDEGRAIG
jgi:hypothetical protein